MKRNLLVLFAALLWTCHLAAQGTAFTYQGRLANSNGPVNGLYDFQFTVRDAANGGAGVGVFPMAATLPVTNGLFTVTLDPGANVFTGPNRWLDIAVRTNGAPSYTNLSPRQPITATPYAVRASGAAIASGVTAGAVTAAGLAPGAVSRLSTPSGSISNAVQVDANGLVGIGTNAPAAGLQIVNGAAFPTLQVIATLRNEMDGYTNLDNPFNMAIWSNTLAVIGTGGDAVTLIDVSNPASPVPLSQFRQGEGDYANLLSISSVAIRSNLLVIGSRPLGIGVVTLIDISDPANPVKLTELQSGVGGWNQLNGVFAIAISGNLMAISALDDNAVTLADISNPAAPIKRVEIVDESFGFTNIASPTGVAIQGNLLAIGSYSDNAVTLANISNPSNPIKISELRDEVGGYGTLGGVYSVALSTNGLLAVGTIVDLGLTLVSVTNPASPVKLAEWVEGANGIDSLNGVPSIAFSGNRLAATGFYDSAVNLFDISNLSNPRLISVVRDGVAGFNTLGGAGYVVFAGTNLAVTASSDDAVVFLGPTTATVGLVSHNRVGIGTTQPRAALDVIGDVVVDRAGIFDINANLFEFGLNASATGSNAIAAGAETKALGNYAVALGFGALASNANSTAIGMFTVAGGQGATALGVNTEAQGAYSTALGFYSKANGDISFAAGDNSIASGYVSFALGEAVVASGDFAVALGYNSYATNSAMAVGTAAVAMHDGAFVWSDRQFVPFESTAPNQFLIRASGGVGINTNDPGTAALNVAGTVVATRFIGDASGLTGFSNISSTVSFTNAANVFVGNFTGNGLNLTNVNATSLGGLNSSNFWRLGGNNVAAGHFLGSTNSQPLELRVNNQRVLRFETDPGLVGTPNIVGGSSKNFVQANVAGAVIAGGGATNYGFTGIAQTNAIGADFGFIGGGRSNAVQNLASDAVVVGGVQNVIGTNCFTTVIGGGFNNRVGLGSYNSVIGGGSRNTVLTNSFSSVISGGQENSILIGSQVSVIGGGFQNTISSNANSSTISGGGNNTNVVNAQFATIPGGRNNTAASYAFAAGRSSQATNAGSFVWNDGAGVATASTNDNSVTMRAAGGYRLMSSSATIGVYLAPGSGAWTSLSDRDSKEAFAPVDTKAVLDKVLALPMQTWRYKGQDENVRHLGPVSQDFRAAFGLGETELGISTVDADGVAFAAIQGLNRKIEEKDDEIRALKKRLESIEKLLQSQQH